MKEETYRVRRNKAVEIVDSQKHSWGNMAVTKEGEIQFNTFERKGRGEIMLSIHKKVLELRLFGEGNSQVVIRVTPGATEMRLYERDGTHDLKVSVGRQRMPDIQVKDKDDCWRKFIAEA
jgi:hypothetical protein